MRNRLGVECVVQSVGCAWIWTGEFISEKGGRVSRDDFVRKRKFSN